MDPWKIVGRVLFLPLRVVVFQLRELKMGQDKFLLVTDLIVVSVSAVCDAVKGLKEGVENFDPLVITQASSQKGVYSISSICSGIQRGSIGRFVTVDGYEAYYGDCVATVTGLDADRLGYFDIEDEIMKLGYENWGRICYKHRTTREFKDITDDAGVMDCLGQMQGNKRYVEIYVQTEHLKKPCGVAVCQQENGSRNRVSEVAEVDQAKDTSEKLICAYNMVV
ncbi:anamorsin homolog [Striga asiatica]|uniref:Anamorsin homolog n=1 Tax=Striga asiatica TaxID=4170 RepID=A0A5A7PM46_STRAF|nr:anamorsin homolog [Striga asiatica]